MTLLKGFVDFLINPINVLTGLLLLSVLSFCLKRYRWSRQLAIGFAVIFLLTSFSPVPDWLVSSLETRYNPLLDITDLDTADHHNILVLGSGHTSDPDLPATAQLSSVASNRLLEGIRLHELLPQSRLVLSGDGDVRDICALSVL